MKLSAEAEKMGRLLQGTQVDEAQVLGKSIAFSRGARDQERPDILDGAHQEHAHSGAAVKLRRYASEGVEGVVTASHSQRDET